MAKKKKHKPDNFFHDGLSIDESRMSVLIVTYLVSFVVTLVFCIYTKDVESMKSIFFSTITAVTGINITNSIVNRTSNKKNEDQNTLPEYSEAIDGEDEQCH